MEDYARSYDIDGIMWGSERHGALGNALGASHDGAGSDPGCQFCQRKVGQEDRDWRFPTESHGLLGVKNDVVGEGRIRSQFVSGSREILARLREPSADFRNKGGVMQHGVAFPRG